MAVYEKTGWVGASGTLSGSATVVKIGAGAYAATSSPVAVHLPSPRNGLDPSPTTHAVVHVPAVPSLYPSPVAHDLVAQGTEVVLVLLVFVIVGGRAVWHLVRCD